MKLEVRTIVDVKIGDMKWEEVLDLHRDMQKVLGPWRRSGACWVRQSLSLLVPEAAKVNADPQPPNEDGSAKPPTDRDLKDMAKCDEELRKTYTLIAR